MRQIPEHLRDSVNWYGQMKTKPYQIQPETWEQILFMGWLHKYFPDIWAVTFATGNGFKSTPKTINIYKSAGLKPGTPDLFIAYPTHRFHGCFLELKRQRGGRTSDIQKEMCQRFRDQGYYVAVCHGFQAAATTFLRYLFEP